MEAVDLKPMRLAFDPSTGDLHKVLTPPSQPGGTFTAQLVMEYVGKSSGLRPPSRDIVRTYPAGEWRDWVEPSDDVMAMYDHAYGR